MNRPRRTSANYKYSIDESKDATSSPKSKSRSKSPKPSKTLSKPTTTSTSMSNETPPRTKRRIQTRESNKNKTFILDSPTSSISFDDIDNEYNEDNINNDADSHSIHAMTDSISISSTSSNNSENDELSSTSNSPLQSTNNNATIPRRQSRVQSKSFDYSLDFKQINFRERPDLYKIGRGEQGVLLVEPYKSEILPYWRFATPEKATESSNKIYALFLTYLNTNDFIGADMSRKFLQMGYTRSRRYANHKGGKKYDGPVPINKKGLSGSHGRTMLPYSEEAPIKAESARIFKAKWELALQNEKYQQLKEQFLNGQH